MPFEGVELYKVYRQNSEHWTNRNGLMSLADYVGLYHYIYFLSVFTEKLYSKPLERLIATNKNISNKLNFSEVYQRVNYIGSHAKFT